MRKQELLDEIATLRRRLELMGMDGDCAYEHAISKLYRYMIREREKQIAALQVSFH